MPWRKVVPVLCKKCKKLDLVDPALTCFVSLTSQVLEHLDEPQRSPHGSDVQWLSGMDRASKETASAASSALSAFLVAMGNKLLCFGGSQPRTKLKDNDPFFRIDSVTLEV